MIYDMELRSGILRQMNGGKNLGSILIDNLITKNVFASEHFKYAPCTEGCKSIELGRFFLSSGMYGVYQIYDEGYWENIYTKRQKIFFKIMTIELRGDTSISHLIKHLSIIYIGILCPFLIPTHLTGPDDPTISSLCCFYFYENGIICGS